MVRHVPPTAPVRWFLVLALLLFFAPIVGAAELPAGFAEIELASDLTGGTAMAFAPDGRLFVCQQEGALRVIKNGVLLTEPFLTVNADATGERGLLGIAFDPNFSQNGFVYVYYTADVSPRHNQVSRFTADGDTAVPNSEVVILQLDELSSATIHNGGAMHFGPDNKLYVAVGDNAMPTSAQDLQNLFGKMLRINSDGSIPADNPFFNTTDDNNRAIWARGLRNPFTFAFLTNSQRMFINDVGENEWEEINDGLGGSNYGWPQSEGPTSNPLYRAPLFAYEHGVGLDSGCAITGGSFYDPPVQQFPASYTGKYFFADFCSGWIRVLDPMTNTVQPFASGLSLPVDLKVGPNGSLFYLSRGGDAVFQIFFTGTRAPVITSHPSSQIVPVGGQATFTVAATGEEPIHYQWQKSGADIPGANTATLILPSVAPADNGTEFSCVVTNPFGSVTSNAATLTITSNRPPLATITTPAEGSTYSAGDEINFSGIAEDPEDGLLPPSVFTWQVDFHHASHVHPFLPPTTGVQSGSFIIPAVGEKSPDVWYRIHLSVTDSGGLRHEVFRDILPRLADVTLLTEPAGLQISLDGRPMSTPASFVGVTGVIRSISTEQLQSLNGVVYEFQGWSDGGAVSHDISTPADDSTIVAQFAQQNSVANSVQFSATNYSASEHDGHVDITLTRSGDLLLPLSVDYATADVTATDRSDYLATLGTLSFAPGESNKNIKILLTDGVVVENTETFSISLTNVVGQSALGTPNIATVTIFDDDTVPPISNPIDDPVFFVRQHYQDFLNREADAAGLQFWSNKIIQCGADAECIEITRQHVSAAFFFSIEFQETGYLVYRLNVASFGRFPRFRESIRDTRKLGHDVIVGSGDWQQQLENNRHDYIAEFMERPEFEAEYPESLTPTEFVDKLDAHTGLALSPLEREQLIGRLTDGTSDRSEVLLTIASDTDFQLRELNRAFVLMQYFGYLRRNPDDPPDVDFDGYDFWLNKLNQFNGNYERAEMVRAFINSQEYRQRFGP